MVGAHTATIVKMPIVTASYDANVNFILGTRMGVKREQNAPSRTIRDQATVVMVR